MAREGKKLPWQLRLQVVVEPWLYMFYLLYTFGLLSHLILIK